MPGGSRPLGCPQLKPVIGAHLFLGRRWRLEEEQRGERSPRLALVAAAKVGLLGKRFTLAYVVHTLFLYELAWRIRTSIDGRAPGWYA